MSAQTMFSTAELSLAAYSILSSGETRLQVSALQGQGRGMASTQAAEFARRYPTIIAQFDGDQTGPSFSATVFREASGGLTVAIRGTVELLGDILPTNFDIIAAGAGYDQIVAMVNWWNSANALEGHMVQQFRLSSLPVGSIPSGAVVLNSDGFTAYVLHEAPIVAEKNGELVGVLAAGQKVNVTGHSLGGHLAMAFSTIFANRTDQVTVFNAMGFKDTEVNQAFFAKLGGSIPMPDQGPITNVAADESLVNREGYFFAAGRNSKPGTWVEIAIEKQLGSNEPNPFFPAFNHSIVALTDSLAVLNLLSELDPTLNETRLGDYKAILNRAAQGTAGGLEHIVDTLQVLFELGRDLLPVGNNRREQLYQAIYGDSTKGIVGLVPAINSSQLRGQVQIQPMPADVASLVTAASQEGLAGLAYRYALKNLDSFVVLGEATGSLYAEHNANGELDLHDVATRTGTLTAQWLQDRADFRERKLYINGLDTDKYYQVPSTDPENPLLPPDAQGVAYRHQARLYVDLGSGFTANSGPNPNPLKHIVFGTDGVDIIHAPVGGLADKLYGGAGADFLAGYYGDDYLEGGAGFDVYQFVTGNAADTVLDTDGKGLLVRNAAPLALGVKVSPDAWQLGGTTYTREGTTLEITFADNAADRITVRDFDFQKAQAGGYLGIRLIEPIAVPEVTNVLAGDRTLTDADPQAEGVQVGYDMWGNEVTEEPEVARADALYGRDTASDLIRGGAGNDAIFGDTEQLTVPGPRSNPQSSAVGEADRIEGGAGRDIVAAGAGDDWVEGGPDGDILAGNEGNDTLYADSSNGQTLTIGDAIAQGNAQEATTGLRDLLTGDAGDDILISSSGADYLAGGEGADLIIGGGGNDTIYGDRSVSGATLDWAISRVVDVVDGVATYTVVASGLTGVDGEGGADVIYAGAGDDWVFAGGGDDFVDAGPGNDVVLGEAGSDIVFGGAGDDVLDGDSAEANANGTYGDDYLDGGDGNDTLFGGKGNDILIGGAGDDQLLGGDGDDVLHGGAGIDVLQGGAGKDTYLYFRGDGEDIIIDPDITTASEYRSSVVLGPGIHRHQVKFRLGSLMLDFGEGDALHIQGFDHEDPWSTPVLDAIHFADGEVMTFEDILEQGFDFDGTGADDEIRGTVLTDSIFAGAGNDTVYGLAGDDLLDGGEGDDVLYGGEGNDVLLGGAGEDTLDGGAGDDVLQGGAGADAYVIYGGMGADVITDGEGGEANALQLGAGLASENLATARSGDDLVVSLRGLEDSVTITDYYTRAQDWVVRGFGGEEVALQEVIDRPDPHGGDYIARLWADTKLGATARVYGQAYAIGWKPLDDDTFEGDHERAFVDYLRQTTVETFTRLDPPNEQLAQNTFENIEHEVAAFGGREDTTFRWVHHSFEAGYVAGDGALIQGSWIQLGQSQSAGQALLTLRPDSLLIGHRLQQWTSPGTVVSYDSGSETILAFVAYENEVESYSRFADVTRVEPDPGAWLHEKGQVVGNKVLVDVSRLENRYLAVNEIVGGSSDNTILAGQSPLNFALTTLIDGGAGNDVLIGDGGLLYGNAGDDLLTGANAILIGGDGNDTLIGRGGTRFAYTATETGIDAIGETAVATESYLGWYFGNLGVADWRESAHNGGRYRVDLGDGPPAYYDTLAQAEAAGGIGIEFIEPLSSPAPIIRRGDSTMLATLESEGVLVRDVVSFGPGIALGDLALTLRAGDTLEVRWNGGVAGFDLAVPDANYGFEGDAPIHADWESYTLGEGVELFEFADGSRYTLEEILALAGEDTGTTDRYQFHRGSGSQVIEGPWIGVNFAPGIALADLYIVEDGSEDLVFGVRADSALGRIPGWYADPLAIPQWEFTFADGTVLDADGITRLGRTRLGNASDDFLVGDPLFASALYGLEGSDRLHGGEGNDLLDGGPGFDLLRGGAGEDLLEDREDRNFFDAGAGDDYVYLEGPALVIGGAGDDWIELRGAGAVLAFNPGDGADTIYAAEAFTLSIGGGVAPADLSLSADGDDLVLHVGPADTLRLSRQWESEPQAWPAITLQLFGSAHTYDLTAAIDEFRAARDADPALAGYALGEALAAHHLSSSESAALGGAAAHQYATTGSTAALADARILALLRDELFGLAPQAIAVDGANTAPVLAAPLADRSFEAGTPFSFALPAGTFVDADAADTLAYAATLFGGGTLPAWLDFLPESGTFAGSPASGDIGLLHLQVTAADAAGATAQDDFGLVIHAAAGSTVIGGAGEDLLYGGSGDETLIGRSGDDYLYGDDGDDLLRGGAGTDVLQGGAGNDVLRGGAGQNVLEGGAGNDLIHGGAGSAFIAGGAGNDILRVGKGNDVIAFNAGDGMDTIYGGRDGGNTLSFGGGIRYSDIRLSRSGKDLVVSTGEDEGVTLKNWYRGNHSVLTLQIILDATDEFDADSADPLYASRVQSFDFLGMVGAYDAARAAAPGLTSWEITNALLAFHLGGADDAAIGGDLAYWYGRNRGLTGISLQAAQQVIGASSFGAEAQALRPFSGLQEGFAKLA